MVEVEPLSGSLNLEEDASTILNDQSTLPEPCGPHPLDTSLLQTGVATTLDETQQVSQPNPAQDASNTRQQPDLIRDLDTQLAKPSTTQGKGTTTLGLAKSNNVSLPPDTGKTKSKEEGDPEPSSPDPRKGHSDTPPGQSELPRSLKTHPPQAPTPQTTVVGTSDKSSTATMQTESTAPGTLNRDKVVTVDPKQPVYTTDAPTS